VSRRRARAAAALIAAALALTTACGDDGGEVPPSSTVAASQAPSTSGPRPGAVVPQGFDRVSVALTRPDGTVVTWCVWLADTAALRARGLMEVTDLGEADGMLFRFGQPTEGRFYMLRTRLPLSIAFFGADGRLVSTEDLAPCPDDDDDPLCPRYGASGPYIDALEVPQGALAGAGIGPGTLLAVGGGC